MVTLFYLSGIVAVIATLLAITQRHAVHALLYLVVSLLAVAVDFYVLGAVFVAALEVMSTRLSDYESAITDQTGLILRCHPSNFRIVGFTEEVAASDLACLGKVHGIPVMDDLGSGAI